MKSINNKENNNSVYTNTLNVLDFKFQHFYDLFIASRICNNYALLPKVCLIDDNI